jgi:hypothetical protein
MAREYRVQLIDDISGEEAQETVTFALDGVQYEIDLTDGHAAELREHLGPFIAKGRRLHDGAASGRPRTTAAIGRDESKKIREWAQEHGYTPSSRGRISQSIVQAYAAAHG